MPECKVIARVRTPFPEKFGVPRQSGLVPEAKATIVFEPEFRNADALRGIEGFTHLWLIWYFDKAVKDTWSPTVRPPRLGGNTRIGVFATRSPFRPNPIGLSSVKLESVEFDSGEGPILHVCGIDMVDGTPILDIKPYIAYCDSHEDAIGGFTSNLDEANLDVSISSELLNKIPVDEQEGLIGVLEQDPRPRYQDDKNRIYGLAYGNMNIKFSVDGKKLTVVGVESR